MNSTEMLDYALGGLDGPAHEQAERVLASDPITAETVASLTRAIHALCNDGESYAPPPGLARRTVQFAAHASRRKRSILDFVPVAVPFRWADVAVAAGILVAGLLTLMPAVQRSKIRMEQAGCGYNLQQLGRALWQYGSQHHHYPFGPEHNQNAPTGSFVALLRDSGLLTDLATLNCPCTGPETRTTRLPDFSTVCELHQTDPKRCGELLAFLDYAYNVGYRHKSGRVEPINAIHSGKMPLLADQPAYQQLRLIRPGNSPNHGGRGQNVLYSDLHVGWHNTRRLGPNDPDMFLNHRQEPAPGVEPDDAALLPGVFPFTGWGR